MKQNLSYYIVKFEYKIFNTYVWIDKVGVWFFRDGDEVGYLWPWKREKPELKWCSTSFGCSFATLNEIDNLWKSYEEELSKLDNDVL